VPPFAEQQTEKQLFETGIKVVDLLAPYQRGGKVGLFGGAGVGRPCSSRADPQHRHAARRFLRVRGRGGCTREVTISIAR
jgi:hypothetical protein